MARPTTVHSVKEGQRFAGDTTLTVVHCYSCGCAYAIPDSLYRSALRYHGDEPGGWKLCCPFGHTWWFTGETDEQRLRRQRDNARDEVAATRARLDQTTASLRGTKARAARTTKELRATRQRAAHGVCPAGCNRHFENLDRHMASKHPGYVHAAT
jgi:hypothetical protein